MSEKKEFNLDTFKDIAGDINIKDIKEFQKLGNFNPMKAIVSRVMKTTAFKIAFIVISVQILWDIYSFIKIVF